MDNVQGPCPKPGEIIVDQGRRTVVKVKEVKGYRPGQIYVVMDDEDKERLIRHNGKAWMTL